MENMTSQRQQPEQRVKITAEGMSRKDKYTVETRFGIYVRLFVFLCVRWRMNENSGIVK